MMKRWLSMMLMIAVVLSMLTVGAAAANIGDEATLDNGIVLKKLTADGWTVIDGQNCSGVVVIPATYEGEKVVAIGAFKGANTNTDEDNAEIAFRDNKKITGVVIPDTVTTIGPWAFAGAENLRNLTIPNQVKRIENNAFQQCHGLTTVTFENGGKADTLTIGTRAFYFCKNLATLDLPQHETTVGVEAFMTCKSLREVFVWKGEILKDAFKGYDQGVLTRVAIDNKNSNVTVAPLAFGELPEAVPAPPPTDPDDPTTVPPYDPYPGLPIIHFSGAKETLGATGNLWPDDKIHTGIDMEKAVTNPNCLESGITNEWIECNKYECTFHKDVDRVYKDERPAALGHNFVEPDKTQYEELLKEEIQNNQYKECEEFDWEYPCQCSRCSEKEMVEEHVERDTPHTWDPDLAKTIEDVPSTCEENNQGHKTTEEHCKVCEQTKEVREDYALVDKGKHTYYKGTKGDPVLEVKPTCKYYGIEVSYLLCDGNHGAAGQMPCTLGDNGTNKCKELLDAIDEAIGKLEGAAEALPSNTEPSKTLLETERNALEAAVEAYKKHLEEDHEPHGTNKIPPDTKECVISYNALLKPEGDGHPEDAIIPLGEPVKLSPDKETPFKDCTEGGFTKTTSFCPYCGEIFDHFEEIPPEDHIVPMGTWEEIPATCTEPPKIKYLHGAKCEVCGTDMSDKTVDVVGGQPLGHLWGDFVPDPDQDTEQAEDCHEKTITGTVTCTRDGCGATEVNTTTIPGKMAHTWGEWVTTKAPTETESGTEKRTCKVCGKEEERTVPATGPRPDLPDEPDDPNKPDDPGTTNPEDKTYTITVVYGVGGTATVSKTSAKYGETITVTVTVNDGYELDMIRVVGSTTAEDLGSRRTFTMPASNVEVRVSFEQKAETAGWGGITNGNSKSEPHTQPVVPQQITNPGVPEATTLEQSFRDIPVTHWAAGEIAWVNTMGYMAGTNGSFYPNTTIKNQDLWMIMAKLMGATPVNQTEANRWAVINGFAAAGDPDGTVTRSQLATALYRCAGLKGRDTRNHYTLAGIADSALVPQTNRAAMIWTVSQGIIAADESSRIQPTTTVTRAEMAVFVYRFCQKVA